MLNLGSELMYGRVTGRQLGEGNAELERLFEVGGPARHEYLGERNPEWRPPPTV
jgi:hypothetical protein